LAPLGSEPPGAAAVAPLARGGTDGEWGEGGRRYHEPPLPGPLARAAMLAAELAGEGAAAPPTGAGSGAPPLSAALAAALSMASPRARVPWAARLHRVGPPPAFVSARAGGSVVVGGGGASGALCDFLPEELYVVEGWEEEVKGDAAAAAGREAREDGRGFALDALPGLRVIGGGAGEAEREEGAADFEAKACSLEEGELPAAAAAAVAHAAELRAPRGWLPLKPPVPLCTCERTLTAPVPGFESMPPGAPLPCLLHGGRYS
jgi:hypothetical protein